MASNSSDGWVAASKLDTVAEIVTLQLKAYFLKIFLNLRGKWNTKDRYLLSLLKRIQTMFPDTDLNLRPFWKEQRFRFEYSSEVISYIVTNRDDLLSSIIERLELLEPDIQEVYTLIPKSSRSIDGDADAVRENLDSLLANIEDLCSSNPELVAVVEDELESVNTSLRFLSSFLCFTTKRCSRIEKLKNLLIHAEFLVDKLSCLLYDLCRVNNTINDQMVTNLKLQLSSMAKNFSPKQQEVSEIYINALKDSKSEEGNSALIMDECDLGFLDSLQETVLDNDLISLEKDQILSLHKELRFLTIFFAKKANSSDDQISNDFLERFSDGIIKLGCLIYNSLHNNDGNGKNGMEELKILQGKVKIMKEDARKEYNNYLPKSLRPKFQRSNDGRRFIDSLMEIFQELLNDEIDSECCLRDQFEMVENEIKSLNEAFSKFTTEEIGSKNFNYEIVYQIRYVITWFVYGGGTLWIHKLGLFDVLEEIKMLKMELEHLQNKMTPQNLHMVSTMGMCVIEEELRQVETKLDLISPLRNSVRTVRLKASFLKIFLSCKGKCTIEDGNFKLLHTRIQNQEEDLKRACLELNQISTKTPMDMDGLISNMLNRFHLLDVDIQQVYNILSKSSRSEITEMGCEDITGILDSLEENLEDLLRCNAELVAQLKEELKSVHKNLRFLRNFLGFTSKRCSNFEKLKEFLTYAEFLAENISCLLYLCSVNDKMKVEMVNELKMQFLSVIQKFSLANSNVREIYIQALNSAKFGNSTLVDEIDLGFLDFLRGLKMVSNNDQILSLLDELKILAVFFAMDKSLEEHFENLRRLISSLITGIGGCIIYLLPEDDEGNEERAEELKIAISDLQENVKIAKEDARNISKSMWPCKFPKTNGEGFVGFLLQNLKELIQDIPLKLNGSLFKNPDQILVFPLKNYIELVQKELLSIREDFSRITANQCEEEELHSQWTRFIDAAYLTEHVIDSFCNRDGSVWRHKLGLFNVIEELKMIKIELKAVENKMMVMMMDYKVSVPTKPSNSTVSSNERLIDEKNTTKVVIFADEAEKIIDQLIYGSKNRHFVSIVGMPGIGKTTLADSIIRHPSVTCHFHVNARCSVSQVHDKRRMLLEILQEITGGLSKQYDDDEDLEHEVYQSLKGRRYLILMDDIWSIRPWEEVRTCFPDDGNGSRILLTSRFGDIASKAGSETSLTHRLSPLSDDKSWEMLRIKIFGNKIFPQQLQNIGQEIAANCKGLPLTVDLVAGILRVKQIKEWKKVAESMKELIFDDPQGQCQKVLDLSYLNLPNELKPCFLYFAAFPEDADVPTKKLILLWIAEGFVQLGKDDPTSLEDAAENMLNDLITRSLITVSKSKPLGGVEASRVHDLLHEFASEKARKNSFLSKVDDGEASVQDQYRLCIYPDNWKKFLDTTPSGPLVRTLISSDSNSSSSMNFGGYKLIRVLDIPQVSPTMFTLIHLRFLAIRSSERKIFSELHKFYNLESFIMDGQYRFSEDLLLDKICNMVKLRHFCFIGDISLKYRTVKILNKPFLFDKLRTLYHLKMSYAEEIEKILKLLPNLMELKALFYNPDGGQYNFPKLDFLKKLESLEVTHRNRFSKDPCNIKNRFPKGLKKLVLSNFHLLWTEISDLGVFENLEILELQNGAFRGPIWDMVDEQFPKLKYLSLHNLDIEEWNASEDDLSCLEQLHVNFCRKLKELPYCLSHIVTLEVIKLKLCSISVEDSAERIRKEQEQDGNELFYVDTDARTRRGYE